MFINAKIVQKIDEYNQVNFKIILLVKPFIQLTTRFFLKDILTTKFWVCSNYLFGSNALMTIEFQGFNAFKCRYLPNDFFKKSVVNSSLRQKKDILV